MKTKTLALVAALAITPAALTSLYAATVAPAVHRFPGIHMLAQAAAERLDLTPEQRTALKETLLLYRTELQPILEQVRDDRVELRRIIAASPLDEHALEQHAARMQDANTKLVITTAHLRSDLRKLLDEAQIVTIETWIARMQARRGLLRAGFLEWLDAE